jgi:hypothetical protein
MKLVTLAALLLLPSVALAGEMTTALSFAGQWSASTMGYARTLFPALLLVAFVVEIVFRDPATPPSFRQSLWRGAIVFALLVSPPSSTRTLYGELCGVLAGVSDNMASTLSPTDPWQEFAKVAERWQRDLDEAKKGHQAEGLVAQIGGNLFTNVLALALLLGQGAMFVMKTLASVLVILLYALGPLALVFWLPLKSDSLGRWLRTFVTVLTWPVMSAVILAIITRASLRGLDGASPAFATIATALLLSVTALAVPVVSSSLVGGSMGAIGTGMSTLMQTAGLGAAVATGAAGGAATAASAAKGLGSKAAPAAKVLANAMSADAPMSSGPPAKGGPVVPAREALLPNAIDAVPVHGAPAVEQDGLGMGGPPPPPIDALSGRVAAPPVSPGRSPVAALEDAAARGQLSPPTAPAGGGGAGAAGGGGRGVGAGGGGAQARGPKPPPPVPTAAVAAPKPAPRAAARPVAPSADAPTAPAKPRGAGWGATIERLANEAVALDLNPDSNAKAQEFRRGEKQRELDRAVKAVASGVTVEDWQQEEARLREGAGK